MMNPDSLVESGAALISLGRWLQRTFPAVGTPGAQSGEDEILAELLPEPAGVYVDVGANHPVECSNTWRLYERGWRGLLVEPLPECWHALLRQRPLDRLCPVAASDRRGYARLRVCRTVSSLRPDWPIDEQGQLYVETDTLANILETYTMGPVDLLSIDVEGHEREVLTGMDWQRCLPRVVCIEYRDYNRAQLGEDVSAAWSPILAGRGYRLHATTALNQIWVRS